MKLQRYIRLLAAAALLGLAGRAQAQSQLVKFLHPSADPDDIRFVP